MILKRIYLVFIALFTLNQNNIYVYTNNNKGDFAYLLQLFTDNIKADYKELLTDAISYNAKQSIGNKIEQFFSNRNKLIASNLKVNHRKSRDAVTHNTNYLHEDIIYQLNGFEEKDVIPINFPKDICLFEINNNLYAAVLHYNEVKNEFNITLSIFKKMNNHQFISIYKYNTDEAQNMDCISFNDKGYVALVNKINDTNLNIKKGSPIFQITENHIEIVQYFLELNQNEFYLKQFDNNLYLLQTFQTYLNNNKNYNYKMNCPIYKWSDDNHFDRIDELPCNNAMQIESFLIDSNIYVAIANYQNEFNSIDDTFSYIYKFDVNIEKFILLQKLHTNAAVDIKYFNLIAKNQQHYEHFLVIGNSYEKDLKGNNNYETNSIIYKFENGYFIPFQNLFLYAVKQFLPVTNNNGEFTLLISCLNQEIKTLEYNGWKFIESKIQLTGGVFGKGVANMRTYNLNNTIVIVVANCEMYGNETNIFQLKYSKYNDEKHNTENIDILKWCQYNSNQISLRNLQKITDEIEKYTIISDDDNLHLTDAIIDEITTNSVKFTKTKYLNPTYINKINRINAKFMKLKNQLKEIVDTNKMDMENKNINKINELYANNNNNKNNNNRNNNNKRDKLNVESHMEMIDNKQWPDDYNNNNNNNNNNFNEVIIEDELQFEYINGHSINDLLYSNKNLQLNSLNANTIILKNETNWLDIFKRFNNNNENLKDIHFNHSNIDNEIIEELHINNLFSNNGINGIDFAIINKYALKQNGAQQQIVKGNFNFNNVHVNNVMSKDNNFNKYLLENIILINVEHKDDNNNNIKYYLEPDIRFTEPIKINHLIVKKRLNNINIDNDEFDILLKYSDNLQTINGAKIFDDVTLLSPIVLRGKFKSYTLDKMHPIVTINEDIIVQGDYVILGNVTIRNYLQGHNLYGKSKTFNVIELLANGLQLNESEIDVSIEFQQPIKIDNLITSKINNINCKNFVKTNIDDIQIVMGKKYFQNDLYISHGYCNANEINNINLKQLNETMLKKIGYQEINGKIHFDKIIVSTLSSKTISLFGHNISEFHTITDDQILTENVTIIGSLIVKNNIFINNLLMDNNNKLYDYDLNYMIKDTIVNGDEIDNKKTNIILGEKVIKGNVTFNNLNILIDNFWKYGRTTKDIHQQQLYNLNEGGIELNDSHLLLNHFNIKNLIFKTTINSIPYNEFGDSWLLNESDQIFTAQQTFMQNVKVEKSIQLLNGSNINDINFEELLENVIWIDKPLELDQKNVMFENLIVNDLLTVDGLFAGMKIEKDFIINEMYDYEQNLPNDIIVENDVYISGQLNVNENINDVNYKKLCEFLSLSSSSLANDTTKIVNNLIIYGHVSFDIEPKLNYLNDFNIIELYDNVWFNNDNITITSSLSLDDVIFEESIVLKGFINNYDLEFIFNNYVSLSKPQEIISILHFKKNVIFEDTLEMNNIQMNGSIKSFHAPMEESGIIIEQFNENVLKKDCDQIITGQWYIYEVIVSDHLNTKINGYDLEKDVLLNSAEHNNVTARKFFQNINIENLFCENDCRLQDINISEWISKSTFVYGNYTIQGTTIIDNVQIYDDVRVFGLVNNITFDNKNILLKNCNQEIYGNVYVTTKYPDENKILPSSIESLYVDKINSISIDDFWKKLISRKDREIIVIDTNLIFDQSLQIDNLYCFGEIYGINVNDVFTEFDENPKLLKLSENVYRLNEMGHDLISSKSFSYLDYFVYRQSIYGIFQKIIAINIILSINEMKTIFAILSKDNVVGFINFYEWSEDTNQLIIDENVLGIYAKDESEIIDINSIALFNEDYLIIHSLNLSGTFRHTFFKYVNKKFQIVYEINNNVTRKLIAFTLNGNSCILSYSEFHKNCFISCGNINKDTNEINLKIYQLFDTSEIRQALIIDCTNNDYDKQIILYDINGNINIWILNSDNQYFELNQIINTDQRQTMDISIGEHNGIKFIVICTKQIKNSMNYGSIKLYRSHDNNFVYFQTIFTKLPIQIELLSKSPSELFLYVLLNEPITSLMVYKYAGLSGFIGKVTSLSYWGVKFGTFKSST